MGYFYFDETVQNRGNFVIGAFIYSEVDLTPSVFKAIEEVGLSPGVDEYKSGARMISNPKQVELREKLHRLLYDVKLGLVFLPAASLSSLGKYALEGLIKFLRSNGLMDKPHTAFFDQGISFDAEDVENFRQQAGSSINLLFQQNSITVGGIQVADLAVHYAGIMLMEELGLVTKKLKAGENSGYDPDTEIDLGFDLWAALHTAFFMAPLPIPSPDPESPLGQFNYDVESYGLYISPCCNEMLLAAVKNRFSTNYMGCCH